MNEIWRAIGMECDLCNRLRQDGECWSSIHTNTGISGFTFEFCTECERDRQKECDEFISNALSEHIRKTREYWDTHPEELAQHRRDTEKYRATLDADGYPMDFKRPWRKKVWNWFCRQVGWTKYNRHGKPTGYRIWTD